LLTADTCEKDESGRTSCVSCLGEISERSKKDFVDIVCGALIRFLARNAKTQSESCLASTKYALEELFQINTARLKKNRLITIGLSLAVCGLVILTLHKCRG